MNEVDEFIEKLKRTGEIAIHPNASKIMVAGERGHNVSIAEALACSINDYQTKGAHEVYYNHCRGWITAAYTHQLVIPGHKIQQTLEANAVKIAELEQKLAALQADYNDLMETNQKNADDSIAYQNKLEQCKEDYDKLLRTLTQEGSVVQG